MDIMQISTDPNSECWIPRGRKGDRQGYFGLWYQGKRRRMIRVVFTVFNGPLSDDEVVRHTCDNPSCCFPGHLVKGTSEDNIRDRVQRGRSARGERSRSAVFTEDQVREIRSSDLTTRSLAEKLGVSWHAVHNVRRGVYWTHV